MNMSPDIRVVAILSPGDMGHAIGRELRQQGWDVIACLGDRSERTQGLAQQAGIRPVDDLCQLVTEAELKFHEGAAEIYDMISETALGKETPEAIDQRRTLENTMATISESNRQVSTRRSKTAHER